MLSSLKNLLRSIPALTEFRRKLSLRRFELKDVYDSYLAGARSPQMTPYGFSLVGGNSVHHAAMQSGSFEPEETALFSALFKEADVFVDVGANIGFYTCLACFSGLHVVAVEPLSKNLDYLYRNLSANNWSDVEVFPLGVSGRPGFATLYGASSTGASLLGSWAGASKIFKRTIALSTLDVLIGARFGGQRLFIKVDVEGAEFLALVGAKETLARTPMPIWVVEVCLNEYHPEGINPHFADTFALFWKHGYEARTADARSRLVTPEDVVRWVEVGQTDSGTINYRFGPPSSDRWQAEHNSVKSPITSRTEG